MSSFISDTSNEFFWRKDAFNGENAHLQFKCNGNYKKRFVTICKPCRCLSSDAALSRDRRKYFDDEYDQFLPPTTIIKIIRSSLNGLSCVLCIKSINICYFNARSCRGRRRFSLVVKATSFPFVIIEHYHCHITQIISSPLLHLMMKRVFLLLMHE
jgi:hypothetical protein